MSYPTALTGVMPNAAAQRLVLLAGVLEHLVLCEEFCVRCADQCLHTALPARLAGLIERTLECAESCAVTALQILKQPEVTPEIHLQVCARECDACGTHCRAHGGDYDFCRACAGICRRCAQSCRELAGTAETAAGLN